MLSDLRQVYKFNSSCCLTSDVSINSAHDLSDLTNVYEFAKSIWCYLFSDKYLSGKLIRDQTAPQAYITVYMMLAGLCSRCSLISERFKIQHVMSSDLRWVYIFCTCCCLISDELHSASMLKAHEEGISTAKPASDTFFMWTWVEIRPPLAVCAGLSAFSHQVFTARQEYNGTK